MGKQSIRHFRTVQSEHQLSLANKTDCLLRCRWCSILRTFEAQHMVLTTEYELLKLYPGN